MRNKLERRTAARMDLMVTGGNEEMTVRAASQALEEYQ
jgi:hypothetical protein